MLRGLFPRLFGQYREGGLIVGKWTISGSGLVATSVDGETHNLLSATAADGTFVATLSGGARRITVLAAHASMPDADDQTEYRALAVNEEVGISESAGTIPFAVMKMDGTEDEELLVDGSVVTVALYVDR